MKGNDNMAHCTKFTKIETTAIIKHCDRKHNEDRDRKNKNIDPDRTGQNYNLCERDNPHQFIKDRLSEVHHMNRADIKTSCSWVVTAPQDLDSSRLEDFFWETTSHLHERYGEHNCIGAWVHLDETTPHLHYAFVPVVEDNNPQHEHDEKLYAKGVITRQHLRDFHPDLQEHLREQLREPRLKIVGIDEDRVKDLDLREYKAEQQEKEMVDRERAIAETEKDLKERDTYILAKEQYDEAVYNYCERVGMTREQYDSDRFQRDRGWNTSYLGTVHPSPEVVNPDRPDEERYKIAREIQEQQREYEKQQHEAEHTRGNSFRGR